MVIQKTTDKAVLKQNLYPERNGSHGWEEASELFLNYITTN